MPRVPAEGPAWPIKQHPCRLVKGVWTTAVAEHVPDHRPPGPGPKKACNFREGRTFLKPMNRPWRRHQGQRPIRPAPLPQRSKPSPGVAASRYSCEGMQPGSGLVRWRLKASHRGRAVGEWLFPSLAQSRIQVFPSAKPHRSTNVEKPSPDTAAEQNGSSPDRLRKLCGQNCDRLRTQPSEVPSLEKDLLHET